ncbi:SNF2 family N-terminal domain-containing protein [Podospora didyma]|uniref:SNF2 family N-terminal domain-containing protein n=1 Tax=Podospora didyma TaxID=330526 RepID=A0AAE0NQL5_9PEZI|nr:SNF2 family N-terminal domain-containing protein [Podospora didyma]
MDRHSGPPPKRPGSSSALDLPPSDAKRVRLGAGAGDWALEHSSFPLNPPPTVQHQPELVHSQLQPWIPDHIPTAYENHTVCGQQEISSSLPPLAPWTGTPHSLECSATIPHQDQTVWGSPFPVPSNLVSGDSEGSWSSSIYIPNTTPDMSFTPDMNNMAEVPFENDHHDINHPAYPSMDSINQFHTQYAEMHDIPAPPLADQACFSQPSAFGPKQLDYDNKLLAPQNTHQHYPETVMGDAHLATSHSIGILFANGDHANPGTYDSEADALGDDDSEVDAAEYCGALGADAMGDNGIMGVGAMQCNIASADTAITESIEARREVEAILNCGLDRQLLKLPTKLSNILRTLLMSHQLSGVNFVAQRERRKDCKLPSLMGQEPVKGTSFYMHTVTGERTTTKPSIETVGGILADEVGLGKTLTMLVAITSNDSIMASRSFWRGNPEGTMQNSRATLVVVPSYVVMDWWFNEIKTLLDCHIVLTTYATLSAELDANPKLIYYINWFRVVLDEGGYPSPFSDANRPISRSAHNIRHERTRQFRAATMLSAQFRWCLTGTPISNSLSDLGALVKFLQIPYLDNKADFLRHIVAPIKENKQNGAKNLRLLLESICLRRTAQDVLLPDALGILHHVKLSAEEAAIYDKVGATAKSLIEKTISGIALPAQNSDHLCTITKLRMLRTHGTVDKDIANTHEQNEPGEDEANGIDPVVTRTCAQCECEIETWHSIDANRKICVDCFSSSPISSLMEDPPEREWMKTRMDPKTDESGIDIWNEHTSTILRLVDDVSDHQFSDKCIIFTSWNRTLDIVATLLDDMGFPFCRIDGKLGAVARAEIMRTFHTEHSMRVLMMPLGTGTMGHNISVATRIHILEPQWNPLRDFFDRSRC